MEQVDALLGLQWGDEGKGKIVDVLTPSYDIIARFQGGPNAGHTLEFEGEKYILRSIPSGIFQGDKINVIGNGVVLDPILFAEEARALSRSGHDLRKRLVISRKAHLILPTHRMIDAAQEAAKGGAKIGTTGKGIGPTYTDRSAAQGYASGTFTPTPPKVPRGEGSSPDPSPRLSVPHGGARSSRSSVDGCDQVPRRVHLHR